MKPGAGWNEIGGQSGQRDDGYAMMTNNGNCGNSGYKGRKCHADFFITFFKGCGCSAQDL